MDQNIELSQADSDLVDAYLLNFATRDKSLFWAFTGFHDVLITDPEHAWLLTLALIERAPDEKSLAYVAAGPLEDILYGRGAQFIDRVETLARQDAKFMQALSHVYNESERDGDPADRVHEVVRNYKA